MTPLQETTTWRSAPQVRCAHLHMTAGRRHSEARSAEEADAGEFLSEARSAEEADAGG
jgi:hypothetical protein